MKKCVFTAAEIARAFRVRTRTVERWMENRIIPSMLPVGGEEYVTNARGLIRFLDRKPWYERSVYRLLAQNGIRCCVWMRLPRARYPFGSLQYLIWHIFCRDRSCTVVREMRGGRQMNPSARIFIQESFQFPKRPKAMRRMRTM